MHDMCILKGKNWEDLNPRYKNGRFITKNSFISSFNLMNNDDIVNLLIHDYLYKIEE
jgi:hypothetical protein